MDMASTGSSTAELGLDFIQRVMRDIKALQDGMAGVHENLAQIRLGIEVERKTREGNVTTLHEQLSREIGAEAQQRAVLGQRLESFEGQSKTWVAALGKQSLAAKEQVANLEVVTGELTAQQEATYQRLAQVDATLALKCNAGEYERLVAKVSAMQVDLDRDRVAADSAFRTASSRAAQDVAVVREQLDALQRLAEATKRATMGELCALTTKAETMEALLKTRARAADVQAMDQRLFEAERALATATEELHRKAGTVNLKAVSDRLSELSMEVQTNQNRAEASMDAHSTRLCSLESNLAKLERQFDADRERSSACWVALEKELGNRTSKAEAEVLELRLTAVEVSTAQLSTAMSAKASADEAAQLAIRAGALEAKLSGKADLAAFGQLSSTVTEQAAQLGPLKDLADKQKVLLVCLQDQARENATTLVEMVTRSQELQAQVSKKLDFEDACTRDGVEAALLGFYRKEEVDAMLARVWWRVGDISKTARAVTVRPPLTAR